MAYTYLIGWSKENKWYYGVRYSKKSNPKDLWCSYFTSSKIVKQFRSIHGEPDVIQVRKVFTSSDSAKKWENKVLKRMKVIYESKWLNETAAYSFPLRDIRGSKNPMKCKAVSHKVSLKLKNRIPHNKINTTFIWECLVCGAHDIKTDTVVNREKKMCNKSCAATFSNKQRSIKGYSLKGLKHNKETSGKMITNGESTIRLKNGDQIPIGYWFGRHWNPKG